MQYIYLIRENREIFTRMIFKIQACCPAASLQPRKSIKVIWKTSISSWIIFWTFDSSTLTGRFKRCCPDCATTTSSPVTSSKLFHSITYINQRRGIYEVLVCFNRKTNERESLGDNNFKPYSSCNSLNWHTFCQPRCLAFILLLGTTTSQNR